MTTFSHSGSTGDTFSSLSAVKVLGGGDFYLRLNNIEKMIQEKLGWSDAGRHKGRMTQDDYEQMRELMLHQSYINSFEIYNDEKIDYELENACLHMETGVIPRNFPNQHAKAQGIDLKKHFRELQIDPYMECRETRKFPGRPIVVFRAPHYQDGNQAMSPTWKDFVDRGLSEQAVFIGLEEDHQWFEESLKVVVPHYRTPDFMEMARVIQGSELFISSMSSPCALALALGKTMWIETRKNEPFERLEVYYPHRLNIQYF